MNNDDTILQLYNKLGTIKAVVAKIGLAKSTVHDAMQRARANMYREQRIGKARNIAPPTTGTKRFILTSAQDGTAVHENFLENLIAYAAVHDAELIISGYTYNKNPFSTGDQAYAPSVASYITNQRIYFGANLAFCAESNTLPTAVRPLSGMDTYTQARDGIFPHAKMALNSVPTHKKKASKVNMTTGTVTRPNYIQKKAGQKAEFHHVYGAVIVELHADGNHYCRHLLGEEDDGSFYDLDKYVSGGVVTMPGDTVDVINWGDIHVEKRDEVCFDISFGEREDSVLNHLRPANQCLHDVTDFTARNHHNVKDHHFIFQTYVDGEDSVRDGLLQTYDFLDFVQRDFCTTYVIESNHHEALLTWLKTTNYKTDAVNAVFFLECELAIYKSIEAGNEDFDIYEDVLKGCFGRYIDKVKFIEEDGSLIFHEIEHGLHGHRGPNGSYGSIVALSRIGTKVTIGHGHAAGILDGVAAAGVSGSLDMKYNRGPSSWNQSHVLTYRSGKRAIITRRGPRFYA